MGISNLSFSATNINFGLDADKPAARAGGLYLATDTKILHRCYVEDTWVSDELTEAAIDAIKPNISLSASGTFTGNDTANRAIAHGLGVTPSFVMIRDTSNVYHTVFRNKGSANILCIAEAGLGNYLACTISDSTNFYVGNVSDLSSSCNDSPQTYDWVAIV